MVWNDAGVVECRGIKVDVLHPAFSRQLAPLIYSGSYEAEEADALERLLEPGDRLLEIGGGCGFMSSFAGSLGRAEVIHTVEANPYIIPLIRRTHELNGTVAEVHHELLGDGAEGVGRFTVNRDNFTGSTSLPGIGGEQVMVRRTSYHRRLEQWRPTMIAMDIEGSELELIQQPLPSFVTKLVIEVHPYIYGLIGVHFVMRTLGEMRFAYEAEASTGTVLAYRRLPPA